jgi:threonine synthase
MKYFSTRNCDIRYTFEQVFMEGLSKDGGLYIPEKIPKINLNQLSKMSFNKLAFTIFRCYIDSEEIGDNDLHDIILRSFANMPIYLQKFKSFSVLELFHGPTFSFKDVALQVVGNMFEYFCAKRNKCINILGATSGDTGSAAIHGVKGKRNINCFILYPKGKVSDIQRRQMTTVMEDNIYNIEIDGNFDDCQKIVKDIFMDNEFRDTYNLASVNSINWARIVAQMIYYFYAYFQSDNVGEDGVNFSVPTGNFGNILAGFYAKQMGLPINKLLIATNNNDILYRIINTGTYERLAFKETLSPAMDITVASNFERLLWYLIQNDSNEGNNEGNEATCEKLVEYMTLLNKNGKFTMEGDHLERMKKTFYSESIDDSEIVRTMRVIYKELKYIVDPHTAVGIIAYLKQKDLRTTTTVCIGTAHPGKFPKTIYQTLSIDDWFMPRKLKDLQNRQEKYKSCLARDQDVKEYIQLLFKNYFSKK